MNTVKFEQILRYKQKELKKALNSELKDLSYKTISKDGFLYAKGTIPVLLVAHLDTVHKEPVKTICSSAEDGIIMSPEGIGGDDRCGIFMILEIIRDLKCHVLFCEDEESGCIGAGKFCKSDITPKVNYIIEFDRRGANDAVFYDCDNPDFTKFITDFGFEEAYGSFTDISEIAPHLGVAAVNISCGYYSAHTQHEYIVLSEMLRNIGIAKEIIKTPTEAYEYIEAKSIYSKFGSGFDFGGDWYKTYDKYDWYKGSIKSFYDDDADWIDSYYAKLALCDQSDGYIITEDGELYDDWFYVDELSNVYEVCDDGSAIPMDYATAYNHSGAYLKMEDESRYETVRVYEYV